MKQFIKLFFKCFFVLLPLICICLYFTVNPLGFMDSEAPYYLWNKTKANTASEKYYKIIILGDSVANAAYAPEVLSDDTLNLALGGLTPMENYYTLQEWLNHNPAPEICYISFQDFHLEMENNFWNRTMYSHRYNLHQNLEMLKAAKIYNESSVITDDYILDFISYELRLPNKYITSFMNGSFNQRYATNTNAQQSIELHGGRYIAKGTKEYYSLYPVTYEEFKVNPLFDEYYKKTIDLCLENGIQVRIIKLPLPDNNIFTDEYISSFNDYYDNLQQNYPGITIDWFPEYEMRYFTDPRHMNSHGALRFSTELKNIYPDDFTQSDLSREQVAAINDSLKDENKVEQIIKWIYGNNYTVIFYDGRNNLQTIYESNIEKELGTNHLELYPINILQPENIPYVYFVSGNNTIEQNFSIHQSENGLSIQLGNEDSYPWEILSTDLLSVAVIDNYNNDIVYMSSFQYIDEIFILAQ